jgi:UbiD family decarboxylase
MAYKDLREWLKLVEEMEELKVIEGADWDEEIGILRYLAKKKNCDSPAILFDNIKDYSPGYRVLCGITDSRKRLALTMGIDPKHAVNNGALIKAFREKLKTMKLIPPKVVKSGPVMESFHTGNDIDLFEFPAPKWHMDDGGRYIGTWHCMITRDPEDGWVNLGTYRTMISDKNTLTTMIEPGRHGVIHRQKYWAKGEPLPVAFCFGSDPLLPILSSMEVQYGISEYDVGGGIRGEAIEVIEGPMTGLPIPAFAEIAVEAEVSPTETRQEGPYAEWTGYSAYERHMEPAVKVLSVMHRNEPIITGLSTSASPKAAQFGKETVGVDHRCILRSAMIWNELEAAGVPGVTGVFCHPAGGSRFWVVVSIKQMYQGHAKQAGTIASQCGASVFCGRYVVVVDDDIDPTNDFAVQWALCTRSNPEKDIEILHGCRPGNLDPMIPRDEGIRNSRAIIDACKPYQDSQEFVPIAKFDPEIRKMVIQRYGNNLYE